MNDLDKEYTQNHISTILLEYPIDNMPDEYKFRLNRFWEGYYAHPTPNTHLPPTMIESGYMVHTDYVSYSANKLAYRNMIEPELSRPPKAEISAHWERVGNHFNFLAYVTNRSDVNLSPDYRAEITALVYEDVTPDPKPPYEKGETVFHTYRYVRGLVHQSISLKKGDTQSFPLSTPDLVDLTTKRPIDWSKLHGLVFVDYRPENTNGAFDMLQAAYAAASSGSSYTLWSDRQSLSFLQDRSKPTNPTETITITGFPSTLTWEASSSQPWLKIAPSAGGIGSRITASLNIAGKPSGTYNAEIRVWAVMPEPNYEMAIPVQLILMDSLNYFYMPIIGGPPLRR